MSYEGPFPYPAPASSTPPSAPSEGHLWTDTSTSPPVLKYFYNDEWHPIARRDDVIGNEGGVINGPLQVESINVSNILVEKAWSTTFAANTDHQKVDLYVSNLESLESLVDVFVVTNVGSVSRRFSLVRQGTGIYQSGSRYNEVLGSGGIYIAISDVQWDAANNRWKFKIVNRTSYPEEVRATINIRLYSTEAQVSQLLQSFGVTSVYTTDTSTLPEPILQFAGNISADSILVSFKTVSTNYSATYIDNVIMCTAGVTITLPDTSSVPIGRSFRVKNLQNSNVTVNVTNNKLIDGSNSTTVGNKKVFEFMNDGTEYRIMSSY